MLKPRSRRGYVIGGETVGTLPDVAGAEGYSRTSRDSR